MGNYDGMSDEEKKKMLGLIEGSWARMNTVPEIRDWSPPSDFLNPGSFSPQNQNLHAFPAIDQTKTVNRLPGGRVEANGEIQLFNKRPKDMGVTNTPGHPQMQGTFNGQFHSKNLKPLDQGVTSNTVGTPPLHDVHVANQNLHRAPLAPVAGTPPAITINSGGGRPGSGVPSNVNIK